MPPFEIALNVRYAETDAMGIVHHSRYFVWLEMARIAWLKALHLDYKTMERDGFFLPVVQAHLDYKSPAFFDDELHIALTPPEDLSHVRFTLHYTIRRTTVLIAQGFTVHAFLNTQRQLIKPPAFFIEHLQCNP